MSTTWKTVRVFLSSTFRDMHAERDHLIKVTFPALREKLLPYRVELYDIDLRWGVTEDEAKNEKVIGLCLDQVDECRPFFLAFLGQRYGWVPGQVPDDTRQRFPFVQQFPGVSVTELELRHGAMLDPAGQHSLILFREEDALATIPEATRKRDFVEADPGLQAKLAALKQELAAGPFSVQPYSASWAPKRYDRVNRTEGKLDGLDDFGNQVEHWLWQAIKAKLHLPETPAEVDPLDAEADLHERFLEMRTRIYVGRDALYRRLCQFALDSGEIPLLLTGASGLGKSAALARFVRDFRKERPDVFVLPHFVGASPRTTALPGMLQRLTRELQRQFQLTLPTPVADAPGSPEASATGVSAVHTPVADAPGSPEEIIRAFAVALTSLPESARVVLVFDALNQLDADSRADALIWLPEQLPANVRVLCSAATPYGRGAGGGIPTPLTPIPSPPEAGGEGSPSASEVEEKSFLFSSTQAGGEGKAARLLAAFAGRAHVAVSLDPLTIDERRAIVKAVPKLVAKTLDDRQIDALLANPATDNPLFLMVALEELRGYGSFDNLNKLIAKLPRDGDALSKLFERVFDRLEKEFGKRLVEEVLSLLGCARRGLSGPELVELTRKGAPGAPATRGEPGALATGVAPGAPATRGEPGALATGDPDELYPLLRQLEPYLHRRDGRYDFYHMSIRRAVEVHYLKWEDEEDQHDPWLRWDPDRHTSASEPTEPERETRHRLIDFFETDRLGPRSLDELPWQLAQLRSWQRLFDLLADLAFFDAAWRADEFEVRTAWSLVKTVGGLEPIEAYRAALANPATQDYDALRNLAVYLRRSGYGETVLSLWSFFIDHFRSNGDDSRLSGCLRGQALILQDTGDLDGAMRLLKEQEAICRRLNDPAGLQTSLGIQALILSATGDLNGAMRLQSAAGSTTRPDCKSSWGIRR